MVARIKKTSSLSNAVNYNEKKVQQHKAECINAVNYAKDFDQLNFYQKLHRLEHQATLNERVTANSVHISLNLMLQINWTKISSMKSQNHTCSR